MNTPIQQKEKEQPEKAKTPTEGTRSEYLSKKKDEISAERAVQLVTEIQELTGKQLPVIPTSKGGKVQIVSPLSDGGFFLCHDPESQDLSGFYKPVEYFFDAKGNFQRASGTYRDQQKDQRNPSTTAQELLQEINNYVKDNKLRR